MLVLICVALLNQRQAVAANSEKAPAQELARRTPSGNDVSLPAISFANAAR